MEDEKSVTKTHIYTYDFGDGGLGDFINYLMYAIYKYGEKVSIKIDHPIYKYLVFKDESYDYKKNRPINECQIIKAKDFWEEQINDKEYFKKKNKFYDYFDFTEKLTKIAESLIPKRDYSTVHIRLGDGYLENKNRTHMWCLDDKRLDGRNSDYYVEIISKITDKPLMLFSDNNIFKKEIKEKVEDIIINDFDIIHTGHTYVDSTDFDKQLELTIVEFLLLVKSKKIHALTHSLFSIMAYLIGNNEIEQHYKPRYDVINFKKN